MSIFGKKIDASLFGNGSETTVSLINPSASDIQNALDALSTGGGKIQLSGNITLDFTITVPNNCEICGPCTISQNLTKMVAKSVSFVNKNFTATTYDSFPPNNNIKFNNLLFASQDQRVGIALATCAGVNIENCTFLSQGVFLATTADVFILSSNFTASTTTNNNDRGVFYSKNATISEFVLYSDSAQITQQIGTANGTLNSSQTLINDCLFKLSSSVFIGCSAASVLQINNSRFNSALSGSVVGGVKCITSIGAFPDKLQLTSCFFDLNSLIITSAGSVIKSNDSAINQNNFIMDDCNISNIGTTTHGLILLKNVSFVSIDKSIFSSATSGGPSILFENTANFVNITDCKTNNMTSLVSLLPTTFIVQVLVSNCQVCGPSTTDKIFVSSTGATTLGYISRCISNSGGVRVNIDGVIILGVSH
jgi:hypothetical protein